MSKLEIDILMTLAVNFGIYIYAYFKYFRGTRAKQGREPELNKEENQS